MKTLIISDLHLNKRVNTKKLERLRELFKAADRIILNGDFWDSYDCTFEEFINSQWNLLFPLLKSKNTIYIYGNHDEFLDNNDEMNRFSTFQGYKFRFIDNKIEFIVQHGHIQSGDGRLHSFLKREIKSFLSYLELPIRLLTGRLIQWIHSYTDIKKIKQYVLDSAGENQVYIFGHTHYQEEDFEGKYVNTGFSRFHYLEYGIVENGKVLLFNETL